MTILFDTALAVGWRALLLQKLETAREAINDVEHDIDRSTDDTKSELTVAREALEDADRCLEGYIRAQDALLMRKAPPPDFPPPTEDDLIRHGMVQKIGDELVSAIPDIVRSGAPDGLPDIPF